MLRDIGGFFFNQEDFLVGKKVLLDLAVPLARDVFPKLATKVTLSAIDELEGKINGKVVV